MEDMLVRGWSECETLAGWQTLTEYDSYDSDYGGIGADLLAIPE